MVIPEGLHRRGDRREIGTVVERAPGKLNLTLAVIAGRSDGYHDIESLMVPVSLADTVAVRSNDAGRFTLEISTAGRLSRGKVPAGDVPADDTNLVLRAARLLAAESGERRGLDIVLCKEIPAGSGLGGGSSDAAALLRAACVAWGLTWPAPRLAAVGARIGSDIPWFFAGGAAIVSGRGERVGPSLPIGAGWAVIARPESGLSTPAVYRECRPDGARRGSAAAVATALAEGRWRSAVAGLGNDLEPAAMRLSPDVGRLLAALRAAGAVRPLLTGSGSACFALTRGQFEARRIAARLEARGWPGVWVVRTGGEVIGSSSRAA